MNHEQKCLEIQNELKDKISQTDSPILADLETHIARKAILESASEGV